ncbi:brix domain-containing protein 2 [Thecamonas trahens ATCC 50062]|uniref:Brix domain-containing protein 2 n=1 Tax=Thecamonas trahens ATCC 50062 TaxID=461836 RepID=A0A0L0D8Q6_THETB|nr:brix domain-containing protein 2 [Thecamonas trahens ATCC 50062]KNC48724.1 brix domain-containing protein 2 [Thecamonas trahens ATCC 50062]|eukprot:XP_013762776.1 brix domain-containing protein 2 [Thecamonas trahens ATCC 50062]
MGRKRTRDGAAKASPAATRSRKEKRHARKKGIVEEPVMSDSSSASPAPEVASSDGEEDGDQDGAASASSVGSVDSELAIEEGAGLSLAETMEVVRARAEAEAAEGVESGDDDLVHPSKKVKRIAGTAHPRKANTLWTTPKYRNKQRTLVFGTRGLTTRFRHLLNDLRLLLPHSKKEVKMDAKDKLYIINEIAELKACNSCIFFEARKGQDLYLWISRIPHGPSVKFHVLNIHTLDELKLTGNALRGSRPVLSFDAAFDELPALKLLKEIFIQVFGTPNRHPKSKPFVDHVLNFAYIDGKIWFRNYQMFDEQKTARDADLKLVEIGPRMVLNIVRIFDGSFCGATLYENPNYVSPNLARHIRRKQTAQRQHNRSRNAKELRRKNNIIYQPEYNELADVFA